MTAYVFMSYSRKDEDPMRLIAKFLRAQGIKVWVDNEKLIPGTPIWEDEVEKAIMGASAIVVVLSPDAKNSEWVRREITLADQHRKRVFPVLVRGDENSSISLRLINRQYVDIRGNETAGMKYLSTAISYYLSQLNVHEKETVEESRKLMPPQTNRENEQLRTERVVSKKTTPEKIGRNAIKKTDDKITESPSRDNVLSWLLGGAQGKPKRLVTQLADVTKRDQTAQELIRLGADALPSLLKALQTKDANLLPLYQQVLARIPSATPALTRMLATAHPILRGRVAEVFSISKDRTAVPVLLDALQGEYFTVRSRAALALGKIGDRKALPLLLGALKDSEDEVRIAACLALGYFKDPATFDEITNVLLDDPKIEVRQAAAKALGNTEHPAALPYLMEALHDSYWWFEREYAAVDLLQAIEKMGSEAVDPLIKALEDNEGTVRKFAATLLGKLGDLRAIEPLGMALYDLHHEVGSASAESLAKFGAPAVDVLIGALSHPEMWIRIHSITALSKIKDSRVALVLLEMLKDPEREVKKHVITVLGELKDRRALPALQEIASNRADRELSMLAKQSLNFTN